MYNMEERKNIPLMEDGTTNPNLQEEGQICDDYREIVSGQARTGYTNETDRVSKHKAIRNKVQNNSRSKGIYRF